MCSRSGDKGRMLHGHTDIPNLHAEIPNFPRPYYFVITYNPSKERFPILQETTRVKMSFSDVNSLCITSQRRCFPVERFTFLLTCVSCVAFSKACYTNCNNDQIVSHDVRKLKRTDTVALPQIIIIIVLNNKREG